VEKPLKTDRKDEKKDETGSPRKQEPPMPAPLPPPQTGAGRTLFGQPGPVSLESSKRGTITLGNIGGDSRLTSPMPGETARPTEPSLPVPPPPQPRPTDYLTQTQSKIQIAADSPISRSSSRWNPVIDSGAYIDPHAHVTGNVRIERGAYVAAGAIIHGGNAEPIRIREGAYIQEGVIIRDMPTHPDGVLDKKRIVEIDRETYSVFIGKDAVICAQSQIHGPARIDNEAYVGMQCLVFWASVGEGAVVEPSCLIMNAAVPSGVFVPAGLKISSQKSVKDLPVITPQYRFFGIGKQTAQVAVDFLSRS